MLKISGLFLLLKWLAATGRPHRAQLVGATTAAAHHLFKHFLERHWPSSLRLLIRLRQFGGLWFFVGHFYLPAQAVAATRDSAGAPFNCSAMTLSATVRA